MSLARKLSHKGFAPRTLAMNRGTSQMARGQPVRGPWRAHRAVKASRPRSVTTEYVDSLFSLEVRERAGWRCARCGDEFSRRRGWLHCSHFFNVRFFAVRYDFDNAIALCSKCHVGPGGYEYAKKTAYREFMILLLGPDRFEALRLKALTHVKLSEAKSQYLTSRIAI